MQKKTGKSAGCYPVMRVVDEVDMRVVWAPAANHRRCFYEEHSERIVCGGCVRLTRPPPQLRKGSG